MRRRGAPVWPDICDVSASGIAKTRSQDSQPKSLPLKEAGDRIRPDHSTDAALHLTAGIDGRSRPR